MVDGRVGFNTRCYPLPANPLQPCCHRRQASQSSQHTDSWGWSLVQKTYFFYLLIKYNSISYFRHPANKYPLRTSCLINLGEQRRGACGGCGWPGRRGRLGEVVWRARTGRCADTQEWTALTIKRRRRQRCASDPEKTCCWRRGTLRRGQP